MVDYRAVFGLPEGAPAVPLTGGQRRLLREERHHAFVHTQVGQAIRPLRGTRGLQHSGVGSPPAASL